MIVPGKEHRLEKDREDAEHYGCPARSPPRPHDPDPAEELKCTSISQPPVSILRRGAAVSDGDRGVLAMIYYNKVWTLRTPFAGRVRVQILVVQGCACRGFGRAALMPS